MLLTGSKLLDLALAGWLASKPCQIVRPNIEDLEAELEAKWLAASGIRLRRGS